MISIKDIILTFKNLKKEIEDIKERILYIPGPGDLIGSNFGELNSDYNGDYKEVTFLKGSKELIDGYAGNQGQVVVDYDNNDIYLMKGGGELGGFKLLKEGDSNSGTQIYVTNRIQVSINDWVLENNEKTFTIKHNLDVGIEDLDVKFFNINSSVFMSYIFIDRNNIKILSDENVDIVIILKAYKRNNSNVSTFNIEQNNWESDSNIFSYTLNHLKDISVENIDVKFYSNNKISFFSYDFIDNNSIKIYSDERVDANTIIRKVL